MKCNIRGLLMFAQRHLYILDSLNSGKIDISDLPERMEVENAGLILDELIENIGIVQSDPTQLERFLEIYCLKEFTGVKR